jgi:hypothetical protein
MSDERSGAMTEITRDKNGYRICTPARPWTAADGTPVAHESAESVGDQEDGYPGGDIQRYRCRDCGHTWSVELPQ